MVGRPALLALLALRGARPLAAYAGPEGLCALGEGAECARCGGLRV